MNEDMRVAWLEITQMLGEPTKEELDVFLRTWQRASQATREALAEQPAQQEPVAWRNVALRVGEDLCSVGPFGYYDMTAEQWLDWALSVVTVHAPPAQRTWVGLTDGEWMNIVNKDHAWFGQRPEDVAHEVAKLVETKLKEKNT